MKIVYKVLLLLLPLLCLLVCYIVIDPFKVIYNYYPYIDSGKAQIVFQNKDHVSVETFLHNYKQYHYDSYIFGSSRSMFYRIDDWAPYIHSNKCFHFDASKETLYGIYLKFKYLDRKALPIKNALIILDTSVLEAVTDATLERNLYMKDPAFSGSNPLVFQYEFAKAFFHARFLFPYLDYKINGKIKPYMRSLEVFDENILGYDKITNELSLPYIDSLINVDPQLFYGPKKNAFAQRDTVLKISRKCIFSKQKLMLEEIHSILVKQHTNYKIVISPHYLQVKFNPDDLNYLKQLFGRSNVFDFSGKNDITENVQNFYDMGHYRATTSRYILSVVYGKDTSGRWR